jgi:hypothetical protein
MRQHRGLALDPLLQARAGFVAQALHHIGRVHAGRQRHRQHDAGAEPEHDVLAPAFKDAARQRRQAAPVARAAVQINACFRHKRLH